MCIPSAPTPNIARCASPSTQVVPLLVMVTALLLVKSALRRRCCLKFTPSFVTGIPPSLRARLRTPLAHRSKTPYSVSFRLPLAGLAGAMPAFSRRLNLEPERCPAMEDAAVSPFRSLIPAFRSRHREAMMSRVINFDKGSSGAFNRFDGRFSEVMSPFCFLWLYCFLESC